MIPLPIQTTYKKTSQKRKTMGKVFESKYSPNYLISSSFCIKKQNNRQNGLQRVDVS